MNTIDYDGLTKEVYDILSGMDVEVPRERVDIEVISETEQQRRDKETIDKTGMTYDETTTLSEALTLRRELGFSRGGYLEVSGSTDQLEYKVTIIEDPQTIDVGFVKKIAHEIGHIYQFENGKLGEIVGSLHVHNHELEDRIEQLSTELQENLGALQDIRENTGNERIDTKMRDLREWKKSTQPTAPTRYVSKEGFEYHHQDIETLFMKEILQLSTDQAKIELYRELDPNSERLQEKVRVSKLRNEYLVKAKETYSTLKSLVDESIEVKGKIKDLTTESLFAAEGWAEYVSDLALDTYQETHRLTYIVPGTKKFRDYQEQERARVKVELETETDPDKKMWLELEHNDSIIVDMLDALPTNLRKPYDEGCDFYFGLNSFDDAREYALSYVPQEKKIEVKAPEKKGLLRRLLRR